MAIGYLELVRTRPAFRTIWMASVVSQVGDWFSLIAMYSLLQAHTGKAESVGIMLLTRFLPAALFGSFAGVLADRYSRRNIMIACDLGRALIVLGFTQVHGSQEAWLAYVLTFAQMSLAAFFDPAEQALIGQTVERSEIVTANTLNGVTWSAMLGIGAVAGGAVTTLVGPKVAFMVDSASYLLSAVLVMQAAARPPTTDTNPRSVLNDLRGGVRVVSQRRSVARAIWIKSGWALPGGAALLLYAVLGNNVFPIFGSGAAGMGLLLGTRGLGALIGPLLARRLSGDSPAALERAVEWAYVVTFIFWLCFAFAPNAILAAIFLSAAHTGISTQWVFSSALINLSVENEYRGRVFAIDFMSFTLLLGVSSCAAGFILDHSSIGPRWLMASCSFVLLGSIAIWRMLKDPPSTPSSSKPVETATPSV